MSSTEQQKKKKKSLNVNVHFTSQQCLDEKY